MALEVVIGDRKRLLVRQAKEWGEILLGFEATNRFEICDETGMPLARAAEEGKGFAAVLRRTVLGRCRAAKVHLYGREGAPIGRGDKRFRFYFHRMELFDGERKIGLIRRRFSILHRQFTVEDAFGRALLTIVSPFFRIWTFKILADGQQVGLISKRWGGLLREAFTDADTFGIEFGHAELPMETKKLLLLGIFLIDFACFENNVGSGRLVDLLDWG